MTGQRWFDHERDLETTETGYSLASADRLWLAVTPIDPDGDHRQTYLHLARWDDGEAPWICSYDVMEGETPVWHSLREARAFLASRGDLPPGDWLPITQGDLWRRSEGRPLRRAESRKTVAAIEAARDKEKEGR